MTKIMHRVINDIQELSSNERSTLLKFLIASMDEVHDQDSDEQWANLAQKRLQEIESGDVNTVSWDQLKQRVIS